MLSTRYWVAKMTSYSRTKIVTSQTHAHMHDTTHALIKPIPLAATTWATVQHLQFCCKRLSSLVLIWSECKHADADDTLWHVHDQSNYWLLMATANGATLQYFCSNGQENDSDSQEPCRQPFSTYTDTPGPSCCSTTVRTRHAWVPVCFDTLGGRE